MIKSMKTGEKCTAKAYARELLARAVDEARAAGCTDPEMSERELSLVVDQLGKIADRLLAKLVK